MACSIDRGPLREDQQHGRKMTHESSPSAPCFDGRIYLSIHIEPRSFSQTCQNRGDAQATLLPREITEGRRTRSIAITVIPDDASLVAGMTDVVLKFLHHDIPHCGF
jgi:hypothetical protein